MKVRSLKKNAKPRSYTGYNTQWNKRERRRNKAWRAGRRFGYYRSLFGPTPEPFSQPTKSPTGRFSVSTPEWQFLRPWRPLSSYPLPPAQPDELDFSDLERRLANWPKYGVGVFKDRVFTHDGQEVTEVNAEGVETHWKRAWDPDTQTWGEWVKK